MWGRAKKSSPGGYTDTVYRSRQSRGFESKSRCCCFHFTRSVLILILVLLLVAAGALSVVSVIFGYKQQWTYSVNNKVNPAYSIRTGWLYFSDSRMAPGSKESIKTLAKASYIFGWVSLVMSGISAISAFAFAIRALCGRIGRAFTCFSILFSILLIVALGGYYIVTALEVWKWAGTRVGQSRVPWPDWAWGLGAGSALAWFIAAGVASVLPKRHKYMDADADFEASRATPMPDYSAPVRGTPVDVSPQQSAYLPSSPEPPMPNGGLHQPMAAQENPKAPVSEGKKKGFYPSWSKKGSAGQDLDAPLGTGAAFEAPPGTYRSRAEEIANRYRSRDRSAAVEMGPSAPSAPKTAWL